MKWLWLLLLWPSGLHAHGTSKSFAAFRIDGDRAQVEVSFAAHDLMAAYPGLDENQDQRLSGLELAKKAEQIGSETVAGTTLVAVPKQPQCSSSSATVLPFGEPAEEVQVRFEFRCPGRIHGVMLEAHYLPALEPPHVSVANVSAPGVNAQHIFSRESPRLELGLQEQPLATVLGQATLGGLANLRPLPLMAAFLAGLLGPPLWLFVLTFFVAGSLGQQPFWAAPALGVVLALGGFYPKGALRWALAAPLGLLAGLTLASAAPFLERTASLLGSAAPLLVLGGAGFLLRNQKLATPAARVLAAAGLIQALYLLYRA